jgi:hypothetical protein
MVGAFQSYFRFVSIYDRKLMFMWPSLSFVGLRDRLHGARNSNPLRRLRVTSSPSIRKKA